MKLSGWSNQNNFFKHAENRKFENIYPKFSGWSNSKNFFNHGEYFNMVLKYYSSLICHDDHNISYLKCVSHLSKISSNFII